MTRERKVTPMLYLQCEIIKTHFEKFWQYNFVIVGHSGVVVYYLSGLVSGVPKAIPIRDNSERHNSVFPRLPSTMHTCERAIKVRIDLEKFFVV